MIDKPTRSAARAWLPESQQEIDARDLAAALDRALATNSWSETAEALEREQTAVLNDGTLLLLRERRE